MEKKLTKKEALERLELLENSGDKEEAHWEADKILLRLINDKKVTEAFENVPKWYS